MTRETLVILPGLNNTRAVFADVIPELERDITVHALDLPALDSVEAIAAEVLERVPDRFHLCGFSFGGYVALAMLEQAPERIIGLALVGSGPAADTPDAKLARERGIAAARNGEYLALVQAGAALAFHPDSLRDVALQEKRMAMVEAYGPERFIAHATAAMARRDRHAALALLSAPLLVMAGDRDPLAPRDRMEQTAASAAQARVVSIVGAGHLLPMEKPQAMAAELKRWIAENGSAVRVAAPGCVS